MTKYELSAAKVLPMPAHLTMDAISGAGLIGAALLLDDEDPEVRATLAGIGAFEIAVAMLTHPVPQRVYARKAKPAGVGSVESGAWSQPSMPSAPTPATASA